MERRLQIVQDPAALASAAAAIFVDTADRAVKQRGRLGVVLSGGSTPKALYSLLTADAGLRARVPWQHIYFFFGDERHVPPDHSDSNFRTAHEAMFSRIPIASSQVFRIKGEYAEASKAAAEYEEVLRDFFALSEGEFPRFDLVLLGMGPDGHTASLFPGTKALQEKHRLVVSNWVEKLRTHRITMTAPVLNQAALVMFMVHGADKAPSLKAVLEGPYEP